MTPVRLAIRLNNGDQDCEHLADPKSNHDPGIELFQCWVSLRVGDTGRMLRQCQAIVSEAVEGPALVYLFT